MYRIECRSDRDLHFDDHDATRRNCLDSSHRGLFEARTGDERRRQTQREGEAHEEK
jgi:hypothetical protein